MKKKSYDTFFKVVLSIVCLTALPQLFQDSEQFNDECSMALPASQDCGSESLFSLNEDPDPTFYFNADPDPAPHKNDGRICDQWPTDPPRLHFAPPRLYCDGPRPSIHFESWILTLMRNRIQLFHSDTDPDPSSQNNGDLWRSGSATLPTYS